jgi:hypothetical protein
VFGSVGADVVATEPFRHREIELDGSALPASLEAVANVEIDLRAVEGSIPRVELVRQVASFQRSLKGSLSKVPNLIAADALGGPGGEFNADIVESEGAVDLFEEIHQPHDFFFDLVRGAEEMGVVLSEGLNAKEAVPDAGEFPAMDEAELGNAQG